MYMSTKSKLRYVLQDIESALKICRDERDVAELKLHQAQTQKAQVRRDLETQLSKLQQEAAARDAVNQSVQDELQKASSEQMAELRQALENVVRLDGACSVAEATAKTAQESRIIAVDDARAAEARLERMEHDLQLAEEEKQGVSTNLADVRLALEQSQEDLHRRRQAQALAESSHRQVSDRLIAVEKLVQESQSQNSQLRSDHEASLQQVAELARATEALQEEANAAGGWVTELEAEATVHREALRESAERVADAETRLANQQISLRESEHRVAELEGALHAMQEQLKGKIIQAWIPMLL